MVMLSCSESDVITYNYDAGCEQQFTEHVIQPSQLRGEGYDPASGLHTIPVALLMQTASQEGECMCVEECL